MESWWAEVVSVAKDSRAPCTFLAYTMVSEAFQAFRRAVGLLRLWRIPEPQIRQFIVSLHRQGLAPLPPIANLSARVSFYCRSVSHPDPCQAFIAHRMLECWAQATETWSDIRKPVTLQVLRQLVEVLPWICCSSSKAVLLKAAFLLGFFGPSKSESWSLQRRETLQGRLSVCRMCSGKVTLYSSGSTG